MPRISSVRRIRQMEFFMYTYDIEQLLKNGSAVKLKPQGYSMYPLFFRAGTKLSLNTVFLPNFIAAM